MKLDVILVFLLIIVVTILALNATTEFGPLATGSIGVTAETAVEWGQAPRGEVEADEDTMAAEPEATAEATAEATTEAEEPEESEEETE